MTSYINEYFFLADKTCERLARMKPNFGYEGFGEIVFYRTYSRSKADGSNETWADVVIRVINGCMSIRKDWYIRNFIEWDEDSWQHYAERMAVSMFKMEWLPPGRGLWALGTEFVYQRGAMALNNCFSGATEFFNNGKLETLASANGQKVKVQTKSGLKEAEVKEFGEQYLYNIAFKPVRRKTSKTKYRLVKQATLNHGWYLSDGTKTNALKTGDKVLVSPGTCDKQSQDYKEGLAHGLIYADGCNTHNNKYYIQLCGWKENYRELLEQSINYSHTIATENRMIFDSSIQLKQCPTNQSKEYKQGFFDGWKLFDGHYKKDVYCLDTISQQGTEWVLKHSGYLDYVVVGHSIENNDTNFGPRTSPLNRIKLVFEAVEYRVDSVVCAYKKETVYCVVEPETQSFMLSGGIITSNCGFTKLQSKSLGMDYDWMMDALMLGVGVGFEPVRDGLKIYQPNASYTKYIADSREGWANSVRLLVDAYTKPNTRKPIFDYSMIRPAGALIRGFGGKASGPAPLIELHKQIETVFQTKGIDEVRLKADIANMIGVCVVAGNVRRSAELCKGSIHDKVFLDLKRDDSRQEWAWMSNNSVSLYDDEDFARLDEVAHRVVEKGEPGIMNLRNFKIGRVGKKNKGLRPDKADGLNPCAEVTLEDKELCNLSETCPTRCRTVAEWYQACEFAAFYSSTVSLLPTHRPETNAVVSRNRRIGVGIIDWTGWVHEQGLHKVITYMRQGYKAIRRINREVNAEAGVPESIKVTVIKPGGSVPKLVGKTSGCGYPTFKYTLRRIRVATNHPMVAILKDANIPWEPEHFDPQGTLVFAAPMIQGPSSPAEEVTLWEQAFNLTILQSEWADNAVSNTLYFKPKWSLILATYNLGELYIKQRDMGWEYEENPHSSYEDTLGRYKVEITGGEYKLYTFNPHHEEDQVLKVLAAIAPRIKSCSLLPHSGAGAYKQMPEEGITKEQYEISKANIKPINWSNYRGSDGLDEKYCVGDACELTLTKV